MIIAILEIFLISLIISYVFKRKEISKIWITYVVSFLISGIFIGSFLLEILLNKNGSGIATSTLILIIFAVLSLILIIQAVTNLMIIGKAFKKEYSIENSSSDTLDDNFIK
ncbi:MAG TPA: hypothetical protein PKI86_08000 [Chitinophagales bacterium]|nr:hypothetical protein [Chitinophagales bacterium]